MTDQQLLRSLHEKYAEFIEAKKEEAENSSKAYYLSQDSRGIFETNIFFEFLIEKLLRLRGLKNIGTVLSSELFDIELFLNHLDHVELGKVENKVHLYSDLKLKKRFDLIFSCVAWGERIQLKKDLLSFYTTYQFKHKPKPINVRYEIIRSLESMKLLSKNGIGVCFLPSYFATFEKYKFREVLEDNNLYVEAIIRTPKNLIRRTAIETLAVFVSKTKKDKEFIMDVDSIDSLGNCIDSYHNEVSSDDIRTGAWIKRGQFTGFENWLYEYELKNLKSDFSQYSQFKFSEFCRINLIRYDQKKSISFEEIQNSVYLPRIGDSEVITSRKKMKLKEHNYIQLILDDNIMLAEYLAAYLNTSLGKRYRKVNSTGGTIKNLTASRVREMVVGTPSLDEQKQIIVNMERIKDLREKIDEYSRNLAINPLSDKSSLKKVEELFEITSELTDADKLKSLIRSGENSKIEFKETLYLCTRKNTKEKYITHEALETVCAFLNSKGGNLIIGVDDSSNIRGIDEELKKFFKNLDKYLLTFKDLFRDHIGREFFNFIDYKIIQVDGKKVFLINCEPSNREVFLDKKLFYIRTSPSTEKLEGPDQSAYIRQRFS